MVGDVLNKDYADGAKVREMEIVRLNGLMQWFFHPERMNVL